MVKAFLQSIPGDLLAGYMHIFTEDYYHGFQYYSIEYGYLKVDIIRAKYAAIKRF